jgi:hypothetical protein
MSFALCWSASSPRESMPVHNRSSRFINSATNSLGRMKLVTSITASTSLPASSKHHPLNLPLIVPKRKKPDGGRSGENAGCRPHGKRVFHIWQLLFRSVRGSAIRRNSIWIGDSCGAKHAFSQKNDVPRRHC